MFAALKLFAVWIGLGLPAAILGLPWTLLSGNIGWMYRAGQRAAHLGMRAAGITFDVQGFENIPPDRPCIFMSNHVSNLDPPALLPMLPGTPAVMLKSSLMRIPLLGRAMAMGRFVSVDRNGSREDITRAKQQSEAALASGLSMLIFVEGTRSRTGRLQPFKRGPFHLSWNSGAPIVPVVLYGTEAMMRLGSLRVTPGIAHIRFLPALSPRSYPNRNALLEAVRASMLQALPAHMHPLPAEKPDPSNAGQA